MNVFAFLLLVLIVSMSFIYLLNFLQRFFIYNKFSKNCYDIRIIPISGHVDNVEFIVRKEILGNTSQKFCKQKDLFFLTDGIDDETKEILEKMSFNYNFTVCNKNEIYALIENKLKKI